MRLSTGQQYEALVDALMVYPLSKLDQMLIFELGIDREEIALGDNKANILLRIISYFDFRNQIEHLLQAAIRSFPDDPRFRQLLRDFGHKEQKDETLSFEYISASDPLYETGWSHIRPEAEPATPVWRLRLGNDMAAAQDGLVLRREMAEQWESYAANVTEAVQSFTPTRPANQATLAEVPAGAVAGLYQFVARFLEQPFRVETYSAGNLIARTVIRWPNEQDTTWSADNFAPEWAELHMQVVSVAGRTALAILQREAAVAGAIRRARLRGLDSAAAWVAVQQQAGTVSPPELVDETKTNGQKGIDLDTIISLASQLNQFPQKNIYQELAFAVEEIIRAWEKSDEVFRKAWIFSDPDRDLKEAASQLLDLSDYQLQTAMQTGRNYAHKIKVIYDQQLAPWYRNALKAEDQQAIQDLFAGFLDEIELVIFAMEQIAGNIERAAGRMIELVDDDRPEEAREIALELRREFRPVRARVNESLASFRQQQQLLTTFVESADQPQE